MKAARRFGNWLFPLIALAALSCVEQDAHAPDAKAPREPAPSRAAESVTIIHNAVIHTMDPDFPIATAMVFDANGMILALGDHEDVRRQHEDARELDLGGHAVFPGLIDSHGHLWGLAESFTRAQLAGTRDREDVIRVLKQHEATLGEDDWLLGRGWDQNDWPQQSFPTREDLDRHFPDRPVWLTRIDGHAGWANSAALARVDRDLSGDWQEQGGYIHRDADGAPTGVLIDGAMVMVERLVPPTSESVMRQALELAIDRMLSLGLTGVHDPGIGLDQLRVYRELIEEGRFKTRVYAMADGVGPTLDWLCDNGPVAHPSGRLYLRAVKLYEDGALGSRGAALLDDYSDDPGNRGLLFLSPGALQSQVERVLSCGLQAGVHAIGDRANRVVLDAIAAAQAAYPDNPGRQRIEHVQVLAPEDVARFAELGVIAAMQPTHATSDMYWAGDRLGPERSRFAYAWRSLLDSGARLAFGSDFPVERVDPRLGLYAAVTRQDLDGWPAGGWNPQERVTLAEALRAFTIDAAYAGFMEAEVGSLAAGKRADFVVFDRDLLAVPATEIPKAQVLETWLDGRRMFPR